MRSHFAGRPIEMTPIDDVFVECVEMQSVGPHLARLVFATPCDGAMRVVARIVIERHHLLGLVHPQPQSRMGGRDSPSTTPSSPRH